MKERTGSLIQLGDIKELSTDKVRMRDPDLVQTKLNKLITGGKDALQVITDFDRTLTKYHVDGIPSYTTFTIFEMCPQIPDSFKQETKRLNNKYLPIEMDPQLSVDEKIPYMVRWWKDSAKLFEGLHLDEGQIEKTVETTGLHFRDGCDEMLLRLYNCDIPLLVFSAGIGDVVLAGLRHEKLYYPNTQVISNFLAYDGDHINGFKGNIIHIFNKNEHAIENTAYFQDLAHRDNVILLGDSLGDANMSDGIPHATVLKIGFLSANIEEALPQYLDKFDIVLLDDQTMEVVNSILQLVL